jgi:hypothetical protein
MFWSKATQQAHLAIWPKITGALSVIGAASVCLEILKDRRKRGKVYHRLLLGMSITDLNTSFWYALSTWPIPRDTKVVAFPSGNQASCTAQGTVLIILGVLVGINYCRFRSLGHEQCFGNGVFICFFSQSIIFPLACFALLQHRILCSVWYCLAYLQSCIGYLLPSGCSLSMDGRSPQGKRRKGLSLGASSVCWKHFIYLVRYGYVQ